MVRTSSAHWDNPSKTPKKTVLFLSKRAMQGSLFRQLIGIRFFLCDAYFLHAQPAPWEGRLQVVILQMSSPGFLVFFLCVGLMMHQLTMTEMSYHRSLQGWWCYYYSSVALQCFSSSFGLMKQSFADSNRQCMCWIDKLGNLGIYTTLKRVVLWHGRRHEYQCIASIFPLLAYWVSSKKLTWPVTSFVRWNYQEHSLFRLWLHSTQTISTASNSIIKNKTFASRVVLFTTFILWCILDTCIW